MKAKRRYLLRMAACLATVVCVLMHCSCAQAQSLESDKPYSSYLYDAYGNEMPAPIPYLPQAVVSGENMGTTALYKPADMFIAEDIQRIYIADAGNNRIVVTDLALNFVREIVTFGNGGAEDTFKNPSGVCYAADGCLYVADKGNSRLLQFDTSDDYRLVKVYGRPETDLIDPEITYMPNRVAVSTQGNIYIICDGIYEGIVEIDENNEFQGYVGMNLTQPSVWQLFLRLISTDAQRSAMRAFIPIEFASMDLDERDFIYTTSRLEGNNSSSAIKLINPGGKDVLTTQWNIRGDVGNTGVGRFSGASYFRDVCYLRDGVIVCLDSNRSHIFLYDSDGRPMAIFGENGNQTGHMMSPVAIDSCGDNLYVLDMVNATVTQYRPTQYGAMLLRAISNYENGEYDGVIEDYQALLQMNANSEIAYDGIGKIRLNQGEYLEAMRDFALSNNLEYYSKALKLYRNEIISENFAVIFAVVVLLVGVLLLKGPVKKMVSAHTHTVSPKMQHLHPALAWVDRQLESLEFGSYVMMHPFKGFWELKREKRGTMPAAILLIVLFALLQVCDQMFTGFLFNGSRGQEIDILGTAATSLIPIILFVVANWCFTTLMDGEGKFSDIIIATAYALMPIIVMQGFIIILSNCLTLEEGSILNVIESVMYLYCFGLIYVGNLTVHQYTGSKAIAMLLLTVLGMAIIIFIGFLFINLGYEVIGFVQSIYKEIIFRM